MGAEVVLTSRMVVFLPLGDQESILVEQWSPPELLAGTAVKVGSSRVGNEMGVSVGTGVGLGVSVGGRGVAVGIAAWVSATTVKAADTAVFCISTGLTVGAGSAPQALTIKAIKMGMINRFIIL